jgi:TetR/AcrR family transcriptional regulator, fatty acid metabolism regulator protein
MERPMRGRVADKHRAILDAAVKVFSRKGFFQSKVSEIAREAGVADGTVYLYFKNKEDLLTSIFAVKLKEVFTTFREAVSKEKDAVSKLKCFIHMHLGGLQTYPELAAVVQQEIRHRSRFVREHNRHELDRFMELLGEIIEQGKREGSLRREISTGLVKHLVLGALDEVVSTWVLAGMYDSLEALAEPLADLFLHGICGVPATGGKPVPETKSG